jgi:hypothetical protein
VERRGAGGVEVGVEEEGLGERVAAEAGGDGVEGCAEEGGGGGGERGEEGGEERGGDPVVELGCRARALERGERERERG